MTSSAIVGGLDDVRRTGRVVALCGKSSARGAASGSPRPLAASSCWVRRRFPAPTHQEVGKTQDKMIEDLPLRAVRLGDVPDVRPLRAEVRRVPHAFAGSTRRARRSTVPSPPRPGAQGRRGDGENVHGGAQLSHEHTLARPEVVIRIPYIKVRQKLPDILSGSEVDALRVALESILYRAAVMTTYGARLRISEVCSLEISHRAARLLEADASPRADAVSRPKARYEHLARGRARQPQGRRRQGRNHQTRRVSQHLPTQAAVAKVNAIIRGWVNRCLPTSPCPAWRTAPRRSPSFHAAPG